MAQVSNLSPAYFSRKFKERIGLNYTEYLEQTHVGHGLDRPKGYAV